MTSVSVSISVSGILFALGLLIFWTRRSISASLLAVGLIWIGALLNLLVLSREGIGGFSGQGAAVLLVVLAGFEVCVVLAIGRTRKTFALRDPDVHECVSIDE